MSATRMFRKLLTRSGSRGVSSVTVGLSSVGPPPTLMMIQLLASATYVTSSPASPPMTVLPPSRTLLLASDWEFELVEVDGLVAGSARAGPAAQDGLH